MKGIELTRLLLPESALDWEDMHQHRLRVPHDLVVDVIRVDKELLNSVLVGAVISPYFDGAK